MLVIQETRKRFLQRRTGRISKKEETGDEPEGFVGVTLYVKLIVENSERIYWDAGSAADMLHPVGETTHTAPGAWVGVKSGLVATHEGEGDCGKVDVEEFVYAKL